MASTSGFKQFLRHLGVFLVLFVLLTGIIGPWVVASRLLYGFSFYLYANLGKMVIYCALVFLLLTRKSLPKLELTPGTRYRWLYLFVTVVLVPVFFFLGSRLLAGGVWSAQLPLTLLTHLVLIAIPTLILLAVFGGGFVVKFGRLFRKELLLCLGLALVFDFAIFQVWKLWPFFSAGVLASVSWSFSLTHPGVVVIPPRTLFVKGFGVQIAEACSGLDSLFMFSALYVLIGILDWKKFNKRRYLLAFPLAAVGLYLVNILRVYILVFIGAEISPALALKLFHTYAGMILFIIYFALFWRFFYRKLLK